MKRIDGYYLMTAAGAVMFVIENGEWIAYPMPDNPERDPRKQTERNIKKMFQMMQTNHQLLQTIGLSLSAYSDIEDPDSNPIKALDWDYNALKQMTAEEIIDNILFIINNFS